MVNMMVKIVSCITVLAALLLSGCSEDVLFGDNAENQRPTIRLTAGPPEGLTTVYQVHFYWLGHDPDGRIDRYEYVIVDGDPLGFDPADTTGIDKWTPTKLTDIKCEVTANEMDTTVTIDYNPYTRYHKTHTFFVRAVDNKGMPSLVAYRSFNAFTLAPHVVITEPPPEPTVDTQFLTPIIVFEWEGKDPIDSPSNYQQVDSVRYMYTRYYGWIMDDLNKKPEKFERNWSPWFANEAPGDSGVSTVLGDDEILEFNRIYIFAVQAMDEAGAVTCIFDDRTNVRRFMIKEPTGPLVTVVEPYLGVSRFIGTATSVKEYYMPSGFPLNFSWVGDASEYGAFVSSYRYGWDITDLADPAEWEVEPSPFHREAPQKRFLSGVHSFYVEAVDNIGVATLAKVEINVVPVTMDRDLLWIDDFLSNDDFIQTIYATPTETEHDEFWLDICSRAKLFDPDFDVYDTAEHFFYTPDLRILWRYKNIIWTYGTARWDFNTWIQTVNFTPEQALEQFGNKYTYNILQFYLVLGGHIWSCGRSDKAGGMSGCNPLKKVGPWDDKMTRNLVFPLYLKCEMMTGPRGGCPDTAGVNAMSYKDYCISVLDKVHGVFRSDGTVPMRVLDRDAMTHASRDQKDPITLTHPDLPPELHLWDEVTKPGRFFDPMVRGFHYVEIYNPEYWMQRQRIPNRSCFHPVYRMKSRNALSPINNTTIAIWSTKYADVIPNAPGTVAAASIHFGIPLWYFNRDEVRALADAIFREWGISIAD